MSAPSLQYSSAVVLDGRREISCCCRWYQPHPAWAALLLLVTFSISSGTLPIFQGLANHFYGDDAELVFNLVVGVCGFTSFFTAPIIGGLSDYYGRRPILLLSVVFFSIPYLVLCLLDLTRNRTAYNYFSLVLPVQSIGGSVGSIMGMCYAYTSDCVPPERTTAVFANIMGISLGIGYGSSIFYGWVYNQGEHLQFFKSVLTATCCLLILLAAVLPESNPRRQHADRPPPRIKDFNPAKGLRLLNGNMLPRENTRLLRLIFWVMMLFYIVKIGLIMALGLFAKQVFGFNAYQRGLLGAVYGVCSAFGNWSVSWLLMRFSKKRLICFGASCLLLACAIPALPKGATSGNWLYMSEALQGAADMLYPVCVACATQIVPHQSAGEAASLVSSLINLNGAIGPCIFGIFAKAFLSTDYPGGALLVLTTIIFADCMLCLWLPSDKCIEESRTRVSPNMSGISLSTE